MAHRLAWSIPPGEDFDAARLSGQFKDSLGGTVDVVHDSVGGAYAEAALRSIARRGRYLVVGFPAGIPRIPLNLPLLKGCEIVGVFYGARTGCQQRKQCRAEQAV